MYAEYNAQNCVMSTISTQIGLLENPNASAVVPNDMKKVVDKCTFDFLTIAAMFLGFASLWAVILGAIFSNQVSTTSSATIYARYVPDDHKLILRFDRPAIVQNPQRMVLLYYHAGGVATTVPGRQCEDGGLTLTFITNAEKSPTYMELVIYSGAIHPAGFPESDVCINGKPIHVDVDILCAG